MLALAFIFLLTALLYASVGFGGGSTYTALLALSDLDYRVLPIISLLCNIIVVTGGSARFQLAGLIPWRSIWPILLVSVPAAWLGGRLPIDRDIFLMLLGLSLAGAGILLLIPQGARNRPNADDGHNLTRPVLSNTVFAAASGGAIGFLSGLVGIGGGIFLAPLLLLVRWGSSRAIAATASVFILVNSVSGLMGQWGKSEPAAVWAAMDDHWPLFVAVLVGGQLGSYLASTALPEALIRKLTAILVLYVALRIFWQYVL